MFNALIALATLDVGGESVGVEAGCDALSGVFDTGGGVATAGEDAGAGCDALSGVFETG